MKNWLREWPVRLAIIAGILNMEIVVIPLTKTIFGLAGAKLYLVAAICSTIEMAIWTNLVFWLIKKTKEHDQVQEAIIVSKAAMPRLKEAMKQTGYASWAESWVEENIVNRFSPKRHEKKQIFYWLRILGLILGWPVLLVLGAVPVAWIGGLAFCCLRRWRCGFVALFTGNLIKNVGFAAIWDFIWTLFKI